MARKKKSALNEAAVAMGRKGGRVTARTRTEQAEWGRKGGQARARNAALSKEKQADER